MQQGKRNQINLDAVIWETLGSRDGINGWEQYMHQHTMCILSWIFYATHDSQYLCDQREATGLAGHHLLMEVKSREFPCWRAPQLRFPTPRYAQIYVKLIKTNIQLEQVFDLCALIFFADLFNLLCVRCMYILMFMFGTPEDGAREWCELFVQCMNMDCFPMIHVIKSSIANS